MFILFTCVLGKEWLCFNDNGSFRIDVGGHVDLTGNVYKQQGAKDGENKQEFFHGVYLSFGENKQGNQAGIGKRSEDLRQHFKRRS